ncbi:MAG: hypothetical protein NWQ31_09335, partial [Polaribacter sp.]|nr:hypothetical protein [Polaribacter sp.]
MKKPISPVSLLSKNTSKLRLLQVFAFAIFILASCENKITQEPIDPSDVTMDNLEASSTFTWQNTQEAKITIYTKDTKDNPVSNVKVSIWTDFEDEGGAEIINGVTNSQGEFTIDYNFESDVKEVVLKTNFLGFVPEAKVPIDNGNIYFTFGGSKTSQKRQEAFKEPFYTKLENTLKNKWNANININYIGTYNSNGVPNYLESE